MYVLAIIFPCNHTLLSLVLCPAKFASVFFPSTTLVMPKTEESTGIDRSPDNASVSTFDEVASIDGSDGQTELGRHSEDVSGDLESQPLVEEKVHSQPLQHAAEYNVETRKKLLYLTGYFALNLTLTIYNKALLGGFRFPWLLTAIHCCCVSVGCSALLQRGWFILTELSNTHNLILVAFSVLFTLNIAISNVSL